MADILSAAGVFNGLLPAKEGKEIARPLSMEKILDFSTADVIEFDLQKELENGIIQFVQTIYIDNADNPAGFYITASGSNHRILAKPYTQGFYPFLVPKPPHFRTESNHGDGRIVRCIFLNVPMAAAVW